MNNLENENVIVADELSKTFLAAKNRVVEAVKKVSFSVGKGEIFGLLGPNGAGKTTLLRMIATIITPSEGECFIDGKRSDIDPQGARRDIGFLSGNTRLYGRLSARELLKYFGRLYSMEEDKINRRIEELVELLDMGEFIDRKCESFSTGQTQRVSIARVILHDPAVLILDEPTLGLDIMTSRTILDFILEAKNRGHSIIYSTHYMTEAELLCDRIGFIYDGSILALGPKEQIYGETGTSNLKDAFLKLADDADIAKGEVAV
ncbi:MAG: ATP-binding cassette domain-containing protein [Phycisphaerae bacterium]|nr:ATP-binding cassette domain-containing protein [Phycisphaerae bacterium]